MRIHRLILLALCVLSIPLKAGIPPGGEDDILRPVPFRIQIGPYIGGAYVAGSGTFETLCDCEYSGGNGLGLDIGVFADYPLAKNFSVMATLGLRTLRPVYEKSQTRIEYIEMTPGSGDFTDVNFDLETSVQLTALEFAVLARWEMPLEGLYVAAGPEIGFMIDDNIEEVERITTPGIAYDSNGGTEQVVMDDALSRYYDDSGYQLSLSARLGYIVALSERLSIAPELSFSLGQTPIASQFQSWKLNGYRALVYLRFAL
jgi:hypothetical protein